jgi:hypothetical protein
MSDTPVVPPTPPAPTPPAPAPVNLPWTFYAIICLVVVGALCIFTAGLWTMGLLTAAPAPVPVPPAPPAAIALTVPSDIAVGDQFVVKSDAVGPVTRIEHGLPGIRGHVGQETQANGRYAGSYAVTAHAKGVYPVIAATIQNGKIVATSKLIDLTDPAPPTPPTPPTPTDPLAAAIQTAYAADPDPAKAMHTATLASVFSKIVPATRAAGAAKTVADVDSIVQAATVNAIGKGSLPKVGAAIGAYLNAKLPTARTTPMTDQLWMQTDAEFNNVANAIMAATKGAK